MTALHRGSRHNPATFAHTHAWKSPEHGGVNATGMTKQPYRCLINSNLYAERGLFSEKPGGKKKKRVSWYSLSDALFLNVLDAKQHAIISED